MNNQHQNSIWIGFDPREASAFAVAKESIRRHLNLPIPVYGLVLQRLRDAGLYWRPTERRTNPDTGAEQIWDVISDAPCATEFSISRFLVPHLARDGWALFMDCDMLVRKDLRHLFALADPRYAVMCVKHEFRPTANVKMDGQTQTRYARKNWSSVVLFNCEHPANKLLTVNMVNEVPGRDLHAFCWLEDDDLIGSLPVEWNWLAGVSDENVVPAIVHHTDGIPTMRGYEDAPYAGEWRQRLYDWAQGRPMI